MYVHVSVYVCVCILELLMFWGHKTIYTVTLKGLISLYNIYH